MRELELAFRSRFLRNYLNVGGVSHDLSSEQIAKLRGFLKKLQKRASSMIKIINGSSSILDRLKTTAPLRHEVAMDFAVVGPIARGSDVQYDMRIHFPYSIYRKHAPGLCVEKAGDVYARTLVRIRELEESFKLLEIFLDKIASADVNLPISPKISSLPLRDGTALGWAEAPRGQTIFYTEVRNGKLFKTKLSSASFLNWHCMPQAIAGMIVPDFPLLNKSFGLSYSGCDR